MALVPPNKPTHVASLAALSLVYPPNLETAVAMNDELLDAYTEFNDAAYAMGHCQIAQMTAAGERLEAARRVFQKLFMDAVKAEVVAGRGSCRDENTTVTADAILRDLRKYDFPRAYHTRLAAFGTRETDAAAALAAGTPAESLTTPDQVQEFLQRLWHFTTAALDHGNYRPDHRPALAQLETELANAVTTLRG